MSIDYIRCHYIGENRIQCESWHSVADGPMCPVHRGMVSTTLAANGINKDEYISARKATEESLRDKIKDKNPQEGCSFLDAYIASIEKIIEEQKAMSLTARAIRSEVIEGMSEEDRQIRRNMKVPASVKTTSPKEKRIKGTPTEMLQAFMAKYPNMSEAAARDLLGLD